MDTKVQWSELVLSVVIPMYNEAENVPVILKEINDAIEGQLNYELIVVNDGSTDKTQEILCQLQPQYPRLKIIRHLSNKGQSVAIINGVKFSIAPWIAMLDGDGQYDPRDILRLFEFTRKFDPHRDNLLITGIRSKRQDNWLRRLSSRLANLARQIYFRDGCPDAGSGLKVFPRQAFLDLAHFNHMHRFLPVLVKRGKGKLINVPVHHRPRTLGQSKYGVWNRLWVSIIDILGVHWLLTRDVNVEVEVLPLVKTESQNIAPRKTKRTSKKELATSDS